MTNRPDFSLLETMLWTPDEGYFLLSYHLKRLQDSIIYFSILMDIEEVRKKIEAMANSLPNQPHKLRLVVAQDGSITCEASPILAIPDSHPLQIRLSPTPVDSTNPFLYHKTTNRQVYSSVRASCPECDDVLLWNERGEITEMCIANIVVQINGELLTPPVQCGLLPGTFRAYLLAQGKVREEIITVEALKQGDRIYAVNSVRKWREALLILS